MDRHLIARLLLTVLAVTQGAATAAIDLNRTHARNPLWIGHARFHMIWQVWNILLYTLLACLLLWMQGPHPGARFQLAFWITAAPCLGFVLSQLSKRSFAATLGDPNGIPPLKLNIGERRLRLDGNAVAVYAALVMLTFIYFLSR